MNSENLNAEVLVTNRGADRCPVCHSRDLKHLASLELSGNRQVIRCQLCRLEFVDPFLHSDDAEASAVTAEDYRRLMKTQHAQLLPYIKQRIDNRLAYYKELIGREPRRILDVGAGTGWMVKAYQEHGLQAMGLEVDSESVQIARDLGANVVQGDICKTEVSELGEFDVVCSSQTFEHILKPRDAMEKMVRFLSVGGILRVDVPNADYWGARLRRMQHGAQNWGVISLPHHQMGYFRQTFKYLFEQNNLETIEISEQPSDHRIHGQVILPVAKRSRMAIHASKLLGHGYLLVGVARKS